MHSVPAHGLLWQKAVGRVPEAFFRLNYHRAAGEERGVPPELRSRLHQAKNQHSVDCTYVWLTDSRGHLYRTMDGGHRWDQMV